MHSAADFNSFYATSDPWRIARLRFRDRVLRRAIAPYVSGKSVLDLGCGEGHIARAVFFDARSLVRIDISDIAIARANQTKQPNARFEVGDFVTRPFNAFDVIATIESVYYLDDGSGGTIKPVPIAVVRFLNASVISASECTRNAIRLNPCWRCAPPSFCR